MTALEVLVAKSVPASLYEGKSTKEINALARAIDPTWKAPPTAEVEIVSYTTVGKGKVGQYLSIKAGGGFKGVFEKLCDGEALTAEGKTKAMQLLVGISNQCADLMDTL
jgi:hypothetical protein